MITYRSTRGSKKEYTFSQALLKGIAQDGGLLMPVQIPKMPLKKIGELQNKSYQEIALFLMELLETDFPVDVLRKVIQASYSQNFDSPQIAPLVHLKDNQYLLELWHGPTAAFKDMALQLMPLFFSEAIKVKNPSLQYLILVSTSGDTGAAALEGYKNKENIGLVVLYPQNQISKIQELTMTTFKAQNSKVIAIKGDFDEAQSIVKAIFNDKEFNTKLLTEYSLTLSAANSINWGRLVPQLFYYLTSYIRLLDWKKIKLGDEIDIAVPSGNFGNLFAAYFIKQMGLPVRKFICASNSNNVLTEFLQTGIFDISGRVIVPTPSPSMNILAPSNLERLLFLVTNNSQRINHWMNELKEKKKFSIDKQTKKDLQRIFYADWVDNKECLACIKNTLEQTGYLLDPHTAVAVEVANRYEIQKKDNTPIIVCSTAHWSKFPQDVYKAVYGESNKTEKNIFKLLSEIKKQFPNSQIPKNIIALQAKKRMRVPVYQPTKEAIEEAIIKFLKDKV